MKKMFKILGIISVIIALSLIGCYLYLTDFNKYELLSGRPKRAKLEVPVTYSIGWWIDQDKMSIDEFEVKVEKSNLNLFNTTALVSYRVAGQLNYNQWQLKVNEVHVSERLNKDTTLHYSKIVELIPVVKSISYIKDELPKGHQFEFKNEYLLETTGWGKNYIKFVCGDKEQIIELWQTK